MCAKNSYIDLISKSSSRSACLQGDGGRVKKNLLLFARCLFVVLLLLLFFQKTDYFPTLWEYFEFEKDRVPNSKYSQYILRDAGFTTDI